MLRTTTLLIGIGGLTIAAAAGVERRLYVTDRSGISVYDIDHGHRLLRKIELPGTGGYKGIAVRDTSFTKQSHSQNRTS